MQKTVFAKPENRQTLRWSNHLSFRFVDQGQEIFMPRMRTTYNSYFPLPKARGGEGGDIGSVRIPLESAFALA